MGILDYWLPSWWPKPDPNTPIILAKVTKMSEQLDTLTADMTALKSAFDQLVIAFDANTDAAPRASAAGHHYAR